MCPGNSSKGPAVRGEKPHSDDKSGTRGWFRLLSEDGGGVPGSGVVDALHHIGRPVDEEAAPEPSWSPILSMEIIEGGGYRGGAKQVAGKKWVDWSHKKKVPGSG